MTETMTTSSRTTVECEYFTGPAIETIFSVSRHVLRGWRRAGLKSYGAGKRLRYRLDDVLAFLERQREAQG